MDENISAIKKKHGGNIFDAVLFFKPQIIYSILDV